MNGKAIELGAAVQIDDAKWLHTDLHSDIAPGREPGLIRLGSGEVIGVRSFVHRPYGWQDSYNGVDPDTVYECDTVPLLESVTDPEGQPAAKNMLGMEFETNVFDRGGSPVDLYTLAKTRSDEKLSDALSQHPELLRYTLEGSSNPTEDTTEAMQNYFDEIRRVYEITAAHDLVWDPMSVYALGEPTTDEFAPHLYVQSMWRFLGSNIRRFVNVGIHEHHDVPLQHLPFVAKYISVVAPYMNIGLLAAPHVFGETQPDLDGRFDEDIEGMRTEPQDMSSARFLLMAAASPNGGIGKRNVYGSFSELLRDADRQMTTDQLPNPSRVGGSHKQYRTRFDDPSSRAELLFKDTGGYRQPRLEAYAQVSRRVVARLQSYAQRGEEGMEAMHRDYPELFGRSTDKDTYAAEQLDRAHRNSAEVAYDGANAKVEAGTGREVSAKTQVMNVLRFATNDWAEPMDSATMGELRRSLVTEMSKAQAVAGRGFVDSAGLPSFAGYLQTGVGTASMWTRMRAEALADRGATPLQVVEDGIRDRGQAFHNYVGSLGLAG